MKNQNPLISVIIATKNRPKQINVCIQSLCKNTYSNFEIIVVDQSDDIETKKIIDRLPDKRIRYIKQIPSGISKARNAGVHLSHGRIISFTDDDCIPNAYWLKNVYSSFATHKDIWGVFGKTMPYVKTSKYQICPCTFQSNRMKIIHTPKKHTNNFGFGNNMSFKKEIFEKIGFFENLLGLGSLGLSAEDADFALRMLSNKYPLMYNPHVLVYHNRLVEYADFARINLAYSCGEIACYGYYALSGALFAKTIVRKNFNVTIQKIQTGITQLLYMKSISFHTLYVGFTEFTFKLRGAFVAFVIFLKRRGAPPKSLV